MLQCAKTNGKLDIDIFVAMNSELIKLLASMGSFLKTATDDIREKSEILMKNKQTLIEIFKLDKNISLWEFIKFEKQIGLHLSNEDNYK